MLSSVQWAMIGGLVQAVAGVGSLLVVWMYSAQNTSIVKRQDSLERERDSREIVKAEEMSKKVALVLYRRLWKIGGSLDGIASLQGASMFVMEPPDKGIPNELIVTHLNADITYRIFDLFDRLRDDQVNITKVVEQVGENRAMADFQDVTTIRLGLVRGLLEDLAVLAGI